jgi:hypothetical protein
VEYSPKIILYTAYRVVHDDNYGDIVVLKGYATAAFTPGPGNEDIPNSSRTVEFDI